MSNFFRNPGRGKQLAEYQIVNHLFMSSVLTARNEALMEKRISTGSNFKVLNLNQFKFPMIFEKYNFRQGFRYE